MPRRTFHLALAFAGASLLVAALAPAGTRAADCPSGNLLGPDTAVESYGVVGEQRLVDGSVPDDALPPNDFVGAVFLVPGAHVTFDLGREVRISSVRVHSTDPAGQVLWASRDGLSFFPVSLGPARAPARYAWRGADRLDLGVRYLRLAPAAPGPAPLVTEVVATCGAAASEVPATVVTGGHEEAVSALLRGMRATSVVSAVLALLAIPAVVLARRARGGARRWAGALMVVLGLASWARFGKLDGDGGFLHPWDALHYHLGAKYFPELGYDELYRCIAAWERQQGRGALVDGAVVRDLETYAAHPGFWTATWEGRCRATFTPARWQEFGHDLDAFRRLFRLQHLHKVLEDHGYNATPVQTALLHALAEAIAPTRLGLGLVAAVDVAIVLGSLAALWWAFGPLAAGLAALLLGLGDPWSFGWTTGSLGRFVWFGALCGGLALLARGRLASGAALVTVSATLRLFPAVFVGALALFAVLAPRHGPRGPRMRILAGIALAGLVAVSAAWVTLGPGVFPAFVENSRVHGSMRPTNHLGMGVVASMGASRSALDGAPARGEGGAPGRSLRLVLWGAAAAAALALVVRRAASGAEPWQAIPYASPLLFAAIPLSGYDYVWLCVLAPVAVASRWRIAALLGLAAVSQVLALVFEANVDSYLGTSIALAIAMVAFFAFREERDRAGPLAALPDAAPDEPAGRVTGTAV